MKKQWMCAAVLAASAACASAGETTWQFTYQGFLENNTGKFLSEKRLTGSFTGADVNTDGVVTVDELTFLNFDGRTYIGPQGAGCVDSTSPYLHCSVGSFSYALTGQLDAAVSYFGNDEFFKSWYGGVTTGSDFGVGGHDGFESWQVSYEWTNETTFTISPAPVPEPAVVLMLPAGLAIVAAMRRRKLSRS